MCVRLQEREAFLREQEIKAKQEAEEHRRREIERRMHPKTASDFEILYNELEAWRLQVRIGCCSCGFKQRVVVGRLRGQVCNDRHAV